MWDRHDRGGCRKQAEDADADPAPRLRPEKLLVADVDAAVLQVCLYEAPVLEDVRPAVAVFFAALFAGRLVPVEAGRADFAPGL